MLAIPSVLFDGVSIQSAPGNRPIGTGGGIPTEFENLENAPIKINKRSKNGWIGSSSQKVMKENQFNYDHYDPTKGTPLSQFQQVGNRGDLALSIPVTIDEPKNDAMAQVMRVLNGKMTAETENLSAEQMKFIRESTLPKEKPVDGSSKLILDYGDSLHAMTREQRIRNAEAQGFSRAEAIEAYERLRKKEAEVALMKQENPSTRLYDIIDSRGGGGVDMREPGNNESAVNLAMGGQGNPRAPAHEVMVKKIKPRLIGKPESTAVSEEAKIRAMMKAEASQSRLEDFFNVK